MANIDVEVKKKSSILPWLLLAAGIAALIWYLTRSNDNDKVTPATENTTTFNNVTNDVTAVVYG